MIKVPTLQQGYGGHLWITNAMKRFAEAYPGDINVELSVGLTDAGFHYQNDPMGGFGWIGPNMGTPPTPYLEENLVLLIKFPCEKEWLEANTANLHALINTPSRSGKIHGNLYIRDVTESKEVDIQMGRFKAPECDEIVGLMLRVNPSLDVDDFKEQYNLEWTEGLPAEDSVCLIERYTVKGQVQEFVHNNVSISIQNCDIDANIPALVKLLQFKVKLP